MHLLSEITEKLYTEAVLVKIMYPKTKAINKKAKKIGQIFTPDFIVQSILSYCKYQGDNILKKHIIDNSCGDGAFLRAVVRKYIEVARYKGLSKSEIQTDLETYIHGIDNDYVAFASFKENLDSIASEYGFTQVRWDLYNTSSLSFEKFNGKMDYVVGNPPYVRVHNLDSTYNEVKAYRFANGGMTDLYLAFFELGFKMLKPDGQLCYITPSSWLNSVAAENMRKYIMHHHTLVALIDLEHFQAFENATAYTMISLFCKSNNESKFDYYVYNGKTRERDFVERIKLKDVFIDSYFYLSDSKHLELLRNIKTAKPNKYVTVKNGFATLADSVFIGSEIPDSPITIKTLKASTAKWYKCLFPYDKLGKPLSEESIFSNEAVRNHFLSNKEVLLKGEKDRPGWYLFGRTQALSDVYRPKLSINTLARKKEDFKLVELKEGEGVYSGLYLITDFDISFNFIKDIIASDEFIEYIKLLKKYKSGGYYTFNSKDIEQYINYFLTYKTEERYALKQSVSRKNPDLFQGVY